MTILGDQSLADVENPRLARIKERTLWWNFKILHTPGKKQLAADAISRRKTVPAALYSLSTCCLDDNDDVLSDIEANIQILLQSDDIKVITWNKIQEVSKEDPTMSQLTEMLYRGFPDSSHEMPKNLKPYHQFRHDLHVVNGVPCYKDRVIIPEKLREQVIDSVHAAHQGVSGMLSRVENSIFWPGITTDIVKRRGSCMTCIREAPTQPGNRPVAPPSPFFPFQIG